MAGASVVSIVKFMLYANCKYVVFLAWNSSKLILGKLQIERKSILYTFETMEQLDRGV